MKTSVIMNRELNGVTIRQDTKSQFFNANDLLALYNQEGGVKKDIDDFLIIKSTKEFMELLIQEEISNTQKTGELEKPYYSKRGKYGGTWMHPYLFMDFAMWLSPKFKLTCIKWIYDNLIKNRIDAGNSFKEVNQALFEKYPSSPYWTYSNEAKMINKLVFGKAERDQRNDATEYQLSLLTALQNADKKLIEQGLDFFDRLKKLEELKENFNLLSG